MFQNRKKARKQRKSGPSNGQAKLSAKEERDESKNIGVWGAFLCGCEGAQMGTQQKTRPSHAT